MSDDFEKTLSVTPDGVPAPPRGELFEVAGRFLIASETLATGLTACALSVKAYGFARFPLLSLRDIFPRSGGSLSSKGEPRALPEASSLYLIL